MGEMRKYPKLIPSVCGVGMLGYAYPKLNMRAYRVWAGIIIRCYDPVLFPTYVGCSVVERWKRYDLFLEDLPNIPGYERWLNEKMHLDKDTRVKGNKVYGPATCQFISQRENTLEMLDRVHKRNFYKYRK